MEEWNYERDLIIARQREVDHRKQMEYNQELINMYGEIIKGQRNEA